MNKDNYIIGIDFDGTCVTHDFPNVGKDIGAIPILKKLVDNGHKLILFSMRSHKEVGSVNVDEENYKLLKFEKSVLNDAINWFKDNDIELWGIQTNPTQSSWTSSPKAYCHLYIDDAALGCPLKFNPLLSDRPYADWKKIEKLLIEKNII